MNYHYIRGITINVDRSDLPDFTNEIISGTVDINITKKKLIFTEVYLQLMGAIGYSTAEVVSDTDGNTRTEIQYSRKPICSKKVHFEGSPEGEEKLTLYRGKHSWPFQIHLPDHLPPSINLSQTNPNVAYYLHVIIKKPWYHKDVGYFKSIKIYPRITTLNNSYLLQAIQFKNICPKDITLQGSFNKTAHLPSESIDILYSIENPRQVLIESIELSLMQMVSIETESNSVRLFKTPLPNIINFQNKFINDRFSFTIPSELLPPSYKFPNNNEKKLLLTYHT